MLSAICLNLDQSKILSSGNGLIFGNKLAMSWIELGIPSLQVPHSTD